MLLFDRCGVWIWIFVAKIVKNGGRFYGMELPRVGAFTEKRGSGYRNPVQISGVKWKNHVILVFPGLV